MEDHYSDSNNGVGGVGSRTSHLSPPKYNFGRDSNYGWLHTYHNNNTAPPKAIFRSWDNTVGAYYGYLFGVDS